MGVHKLMKQWVNVKLLMKLEKNSNKISKMLNTFYEDITFDKTKNYV